MEDVVSLKGDPWSNEAWVVHPMLPLLFSVEQAATVLARQVSLISLLIRRRMNIKEMSLLTLSNIVKP